MATMARTQLTPFEPGNRLINGSALNRLVSQVYTWPGNIFYCNPAASVNGDGLVNTPFNSLVTAFGACTAGNNDIVILLGNGAASSTARLSASFDWNKNATHLLGVAAPSMDAQRARISTATGATTNLNPLMTISATGCMFQNFSYFQGVGQASTDESLLTITGGRNYFYNVAFGGLGSTNGAHRSGSYIIKFASGGSENLFEHCSVGLETIVRDVANTSVWVAANAQRNQFRDCEFEMYPTANTPIYLQVDAGALNGSTMKFTRCSFKALMGATGSTQPAVTATISATANGTVYFDQCSTVAAHWAVAANGNCYIMSPTNTSGKMGFTGGVFVATADS